MQHKRERVGREQGDHMNTRGGADHTEARQRGGQYHGRMHTHTHTNTHTHTHTHKHTHTHTHTHAHIHTHREREIP